MKQERPLNLTITREHVRIEELKERLRLIAGDQVKVDCSPNCDPASFERFIEQVIVYKQREAAVETAIRERRLEALPCPDQLTDPKLTDKLWFLIGQLAEQGIFIYHTDHLTDRELYGVLWRQTFWQEATPVGRGRIRRLDLLGGVSDAETLLYLKHYASESERWRWLGDYPDYDLPAHVDPPYDRDRHMPRPDW